MGNERQTAENRTKHLRLAIYRIERGRAKTGATELSISAVAREAGVTPALIHNHYPTIAEEIRNKLGASSRQQRDAKQEALKVALQEKKALLKELSDARQRIARLASINETLLLQNQTLRAAAESSVVVPLEPKKS